jgi:hypothetical protein
MSNLREQLLVFSYIVNLLIGIFIINGCHTKARNYRINLPKLQLSIAWCKSILKRAKQKQAGI